MLKDALKLKQLLRESVEKNNCDAILLSGGIDTSVLAACGKITRAFTVVLGEKAPDYNYAIKVAQRYNIEHHVIQVTEKKLLERIPEVIKILRTFDSAIPNDLAIYIGLLEAKDHGVKRIMTGDAADELFGGYNYMQEMSKNKLEPYMRYLSESMNFSSNKLGEHMGVDVVQPYRDENIVEFALNLNPELKIRRTANKIWGKWILRKAFESELGEIVWRQKTPIEYGSATTQLRESIRSRILDEEYNNKKRDYGMDFINKEHLYFYELYRRFVGEVKKAKKGEDKCPGCGAKLEGYHCKICGFASPIEDIRW